MPAVKRSATVELAGWTLTYDELRRRAALVGGLDATERYFVFGEANFEGAVFVGPITFAKAQFGKANFRGATFEGPVSFNGATFEGDARFYSICFEGTASFRGATFRGHAIFALPDREQRFREWPEEVMFKRWADFRGATFEKTARFGGAQFERRARFDGATFRDDAVFTGASFLRARTLDLKQVAETLDLDRAAFGAPVHLNVGANCVRCHGTQFQSLASIDVSRGDITLEGAAFAESSTISGVVSEPKPRMLSLRGADVAHLTLADLDLSQCIFLGVHNLDGLGFEGANDMCELGSRSRVRQAIADEVELRGRDATDSDEDATRVTAERIALAYRALRKGREDSKDAPGAADFYFGEMEMRRKAARGFDRGLLYGYWLTSGYALLAWRALAALALTVVVLAGGLELAGFDPNTGNFWDALLFSAESTTSLFRAPTPPDGSQLNYLGHVLQMLLRLLGPLFFGLMLLALRGRVKR
jgi:uncharacterized protein YjbI with pentapeptide repeats